jgi:hypothetical protein
MNTQYIFALEQKLVFFLLGLLHLLVLLLELLFEVMARMEGHGRDGVCARHHSLRDECVVMPALGATVRVLAAVTVSTRGLTRGFTRVGARLRRDGMCTYNAGLGKVEICR